MFQVVNRVVNHKSYGGTRQYTLIQKEPSKAWLESLPLINISSAAGLEAVLKSSGARTLVQGSLDMMDWDGLGYLSALLQGQWRRTTGARSQTGGTLPSVKSLLSMTPVPPATVRRHRCCQGFTRASLACCFGVLGWPSQPL